MKKEVKEKHFVKKPIYPGGKEAMKAFIKKNLKYPQQALEKGIEGVVRIRYTIDKNGNVVKTKVISKLGYGCDEEARRIVKLFKFHVPKNHIKVTFHKNVNIRFKLKKKQKIKYVYKTTPASESNNSGYNYTIKING